jgi:hypothetical protein
VGLSIANKPTPTANGLLAAGCWLLAAGCSLLASCYHIPYTYVSIGSVCFISVSCERVLLVFSFLTHMLLVFLNSPGRKNVQKRNKKLRKKRQKFYREFTQARTSNGAHHVQQTRCPPLPPVLVLVPESGVGSAVVRAADFPVCPSPVDMVRACTCHYTLSVALPPQLLYSPLCRNCNCLCPAVSHSLSLRNWCSPSRSRGQ